MKHSHEADLNNGTTAREAVNYRSITVDGVDGRMATSFSIFKFLAEIPPKQSSVFLAPVGAKIGCTRQL
jgi:hypothetical protein